MNAGKIIIGTELDTKSFEKQIADVEYELKQLDYELSHAKELKLDNKTISEYTTKAEKLNNKLIDLKRRQDEFNKSNFFSGMKNSIDGVIKKITRWGLAIFGIRSAYLAVRRATSIVTQYNEQIKTDLDYIQFVLASSLEPIIKVIINLAYELLNILNAITVALFNFDIFQNASVSKFKKMNAGASQLKKTLAGFDEMNIVQDTSGGGASTGTPSGGPNPQDANNFKDYLSKVIKFWEEDWATAFDNVAGNWQTFVDGIIFIGKGIYDFFKGVVEFFTSLWQVISGIFKGNSEAIVEGLKNAGQSILDMIKGVAEIIVGIIMTLLGVIIGIIKDLWDGIVSILSVIATWIYNNIIKPIGDFFSKLWNGIKTGVSSAVNGIKDTFKPVVNWINSNIIKPIGNFFTTLWNGIKNGAKTVSNTVTSIFNGLVNAIKRPLNLIIDGFNVLIRGLNRISFDVPDWIPLIGGKKWGFNLREIPHLAKGTIASVPGRGITTPNGIYAEAGREAYLPLSDIALLEELGSTIGKYVTINAQLNNYMNGRLISRELQKVQNESDFAFNR